CTLTVAGILAFGIVTILRLRRRYFSSQRSLRQVKMLAHDILASMDQGVITINKNGLISSINSASIRLLGVNLECVGQPLSCLSTSEVPLVALCREVAERHAPVRDRDLMVDRGGHLQRLRAEVHVLRDTQGEAVGCVIHLRDVTERALMEERMRRMEGVISLGTLASGVHHEIKNPLTALSIHIQLLEESLDDPSSGNSLEELVGVLKTEVVRLNGVLESFRNFANLQRLALQPSDVREVLANTVRLVAPQAVQQHVELRL